MKSLIVFSMILLASPFAFADEKGPCYTQAENSAKYHFQLVLENVARDSTGYWERFLGCVGKEVKYLGTTDQAGYGGRVYQTYWFGADCEWTYSSSLYPDCSLYGE